MQRLLLCLLAILIFSGCTITEPDFENSYTVENRFAGDVKNFPMIKIAATKVPASVIESKNITYQRHGRRALQLDLYRPRHAGSPVPAVILVHGGGWRSGYRTHLTPLAIELAEAGYVVATISYRLAPEARYPAAVHDVKAAVRWMRKNANKYGVTPDQIAVGGASAGGQIASLVGVTNGMEKFDPESATSSVSSNVQLILNIDGLSDFTSEEARKHEDDPRKNPSAAGSWFGGRYAEKKALWHEASPIYYVSDNMPAILFLNSARERFHVGRDEMIEKMQSHKIPYRVETLPNTPHTFWLYEPWLEPAAAIVVKFLDQQFEN